MHMSGGGRARARACGPSRRTHDAKRVRAKAFHFQAFLASQSTKQMDMKCPCLMDVLKWREESPAKLDNVMR